MRVATIRNILKKVISLNYVALKTGRNLNLATCPNLFDGLALGDLRVSDHLVGGADLDEGELGILCNFSSQRRFPTIGWA